MNQSSDSVLNCLAGNENIEDISVNQLQKLADENPYFAVAQLLLAKKLKSENNSDFLSQVQKTALYFSNPFWLHYQLMDNISEEMQADGNVVNKPQNKEIPDITELTDQEAERAITATATVETNTGEKTPDIEEKVNQPEEEMAAITRDADAETQQFLDEAIGTEKTFIPGNTEPAVFENQTAAGLETAEVLEEMAAANRETDETAEAFLTEAQSAAEDNAEQSLHKTKVASFSSDIQKDNGNYESVVEDEHETMFQNIKAMLDATSEEADADTGNAVIPIDPYYTIDYFASQGIKLDLDQNPKDQLGQHLKKFTHWLKHMKKLGPEDATEVIARTETDADIQKIAESSNMAREVVTEAMASVLEKQGKKDKAIELYNKLSFLNPDKSAYFAGKIKNLKGS